MIYAIDGTQWLEQLLGAFILPEGRIGNDAFTFCLSEVVLSTGQAESSLRIPSQSRFSFLLMFFFGVYWEYKTPSPGIIVFNVVFL